jgi:hypothetical protein
MVAAKEEPMTPRSTTALLALSALLALPAAAQHGGRRLSHVPPREASQYDFLLGEWQLTVEVPPPNLAARIHGTPELTGTWRAWRALDGWGIEDELRITDQAGNPLSLTHTVRVYDAGERRWRLATLDVYRARFVSPAVDFRDGEVHLRSRGTDPDGDEFLSRTRIYDIEPDRFRLRQDRSFDGGRSWEKGALRIEARRVAATARR